MIKRLEKKNLTQKVLEQLKANISGGKWPPNSIIPSEPELSRMFNVSRNTVRSAVQELCAYGILVKRQGFGTQISDGAADNFVKMSLPCTLFSPKELIDTLEFRRTIEIESIGLACERRGEEELEEIARCLENLQSSLHDQARFVLKDYEFHRLIAKASGNAIFYRALLLLEDVILRHMKEAVDLTDIQVSLARHKRLFQALEQRQGSKARQIMAEHFNVLIDVVEDRE